MLTKWTPRRCRLLPLRPPRPPRPLHPPHLRPPPIFFELIISFSSFVMLIHLSLVIDTVKIVRPRPCLIHYRYVHCTHNEARAQTTSLYR